MVESLKFLPVQVNFNFTNIKIDNLALYIIFCKDVCINSLIGVDL